MTTNQHLVLFYFMERYIFIREYNLLNDAGGVHALICKGSILTETEDGFFTEIGDYTDVLVTKEIDAELSIRLLRLDADIFKTAYNSLPYRSWLNEKASEIDEQGLKRYEDGLDRSPETLIMYLMDVGVNSDTLTRLMFAPGNKYGEFLKMVCAHV